MEVTLWGTRGSFPRIGGGTSGYGGNTTCIEVRTDAGDIIIIDAGTGIRDLGKKLQKSQQGGKCALFFTHRHWDHVHGLTSFDLLYNPEWNISIFGPQLEFESWSHTICTIFNTCYFPLSWKDIGHRHKVEDFRVGDSFNVGTALIETCACSHPNGCVSYKITADGWTFFFSGDHEWETASPAEQEALEKFMGSADVILADAHFSNEDYPACKGWGHSNMNQWVEHVLKTKVQRVVFTHHHPDYTDTMLEKCVADIWRAHPDLPLRTILAREGLCITKETETHPLDVVLPATYCPMCDFSRKISRYADPGLILGSVLTEARSLGQADAGTIYLLESDDKLAFSYAQNETLFPGSAANRMTYLNSTIPKNEQSIAGYVAISGITLNILDVYRLPVHVPYTFNDSFDKSTGYRTVSVLAVPLIGSNNKTVGVLQLINSLKNGKPSAFTADAQHHLEQLAITAADSIERSRLSNELLVRMLETSSLRDPTETANHVMRVGAMAAEVYNCWAEKHDIPIEELRTTKDTLRLAAMLHDVGKVGVSDLILKKPGKLTTEEFFEMQKHCAMGASLFKEPTSLMDIMARNIALHHHQKWNGKGYTGDSSVPPLSGTDIPLEARITAIADVYDALVSTRCYKSPMPVEVALEIIQKESGAHFDPEVVDTFMEIKDVIRAIHDRFSE